MAKRTEDNGSTLVSEQMKEVNNVKGKPQRKNLYFSAFIANLLFISMGCTAAWPSAAIPLLRQMGIKPNEETWIVSLMMLGSCLGPTIYSITTDRFGRKRSLLGTGLIYVLSWIILGSSQSIYSLCLGRFIGGLAVGSTFNCTLVYISEISHVDVRQTLTSLTELFVTIGCLLEYSVASYVSYGYLILISVSPAVICIPATFLIPESPYQYISRGDRQQASKTLQWLRGPTYNVSEELEQIQKSVTESRSQIGRRIDLIKRRGPRKALMLSALVLFVVPFAAVDVVVSYLGPILSATSLSITSNIATIIIGSMEVLFGIIEPFVVHRFGSKWTLVVSSFFCAVFLLMFGVYKYFDERHYNLSYFTAVPIVSIILFEMFFVIGVGALPWSISVELFPPSLKGFGVNVVTTMNWIVDFGVVTLYGDLTPIVGASSCFIFFAVVLVIGNILIAVLIPDTKGRSLYSIHYDLENN